MNQASKKNQFYKNGFQDLKSGSKYFFEGIAGFNNFALLSLVYFFGLGFSFFLHRVFGFGKKTKGVVVAKNNAATVTYWQTIELGNSTEDSYYRPF